MKIIMRLVRPALHPNPPIWRPSGEGKKAWTKSLLSLLILLVLKYSYCPVD